MRRVARALATACAVAGAARSQTPQPDPHAAQPERPTVATHAYTVAPGYIELEFGLELDRVPAGNAFSTPTTLKIGLAPRLQVEATAAWLATSDSASFRGASDLVLALKWRIADSVPLLGAFAIQPAVRLPTGTPPLGANAVVGSLLLIASQHVGPVALDLNFGWFRRLTEGGEYPSTATLWTVSAGGALPSSFGWVAELYGFPGTSGGSGSTPIVSFLVGPTYAVHEWLVLDVGAIVPVAGPQPRALYAGLTWNFGRL